MLCRKEVTSITFLLVFTAKRIKSFQAPHIKELDAWVLLNNLYNAIFNRLLFLNELNNVDWMADIT